MIMSAAFAATAHAQQFVAADRETARDAAYAGILTSAQALPRVAMPRLAPAKTLPDHASVKRPLILPALYVTLGVLQGADLYTTNKALNAGAREANPMMAGLVSSPGKAIAFKALTTAGTIYFAEKLWKKNPVAAIIVVAAVNGLTAGVAAHNTRVAGIAAARRR